MTIEWGKPGELGGIRRGGIQFPTAAKIAAAMEGARKMVEIAAQIHHGQLDGVLAVTSADGPVALGFLDLAVELYTRREVIEPIRAGLQVRWITAPTGCTIHVVADVVAGGPICQRVALSATVKPGELSPGVVNFVEHLTPEPVQIRTRKGKTRWAITPYGFKLRVQRVARPIGTVPHPNGATFLNLAL